MNVISLDASGAKIELDMDELGRVHDALMNVRDSVVASDPSEGDHIEALRVEFDSTYELVVAQRMEPQRDASRPLVLSTAGVYVSVPNGG